MYVLTADYRNNNAAEVFVESLRKTGFGVIKNHPIDYQLVKDVFNEWQQFFASEDKFNYTYDKQTQDGYFPLNTSETAKGYNIKDIKEFYHLYPWGRYPKQLSSKTRELYSQMSDLAATVLQWVEQGTPDEIKANFSRPLADMIKKSPRTMLRVLHYPPLSGDEESGAVRAAAHEDIDLLTLLPAATATGLEVKDKEGNWHAVESDPGTIVVNAGDMLQLCTGHYYMSTTHRVVNPQGEASKTSRFSMPLFLHPHDDVVLSKEHTAKSYLWERLRELGVV
jgi:isopenicillin N synthase-like dioxygenase